MVTDARPAWAGGAAPGPWMALLALPLVGLALLIAVPELDAHWEHQPSHFWIVLVSAALSAARTPTRTNALRQPALTPTNVSTGTPISGAADAPATTQPALWRR